MTADDEKRCQHGSRNYCSVRLLLDAFSAASLLLLDDETTYWISSPLFLLAASTTLGPPHHSVLLDDVQATAGQGVCIRGNHPRNKVPGDLTRLQGLPAATHSRTTCQDGWIVAAFVLLHATACCYEVQYSTKESEPSSTTSHGSAQLAL